ncbi:MAG TPA: hypothetical protein VK897_19665 [Anaerolineales bacterium]|nr:hypothetical protein [Anaerolineales bacterium]
MLKISDLLHLPYTPDLTQGGIAYALHSLPRTYKRVGSSPYEHLRRVVAGVMVELAFRRYLAEQAIPFEVRGAAPFTEPDRYDVVLGGRRCDVKSFLVNHRDQISQIKHDPSVILRAPALVASDQHAGGGHSQHDLYLFAFLAGQVAASQAELQKIIDAKQPQYMVHVMPDAWKRPSKWTPLGKLVLKSDSEQTQIVEIGGQDEGREMRSHVVELPPQTRVEIQSEFFSLSYLHAQSSPQARIGIYSPIRRETHLIGAPDWGNIWVYGVDIILTGYISYEEFSRQASFVQAGSRVFQYNHTQVKNLAVPVSDLKPLAELFERVRAWSSQTTA